MCLPPSLPTLRVDSSAADRGHLPSEFYESKAISAGDTTEERYDDAVLISFEASNYRSIAGPVELSTVAVDHDRPEARRQPMLGESLLTVAAIYGPNASGKSNIISAFNWLLESIQNSMRLWDDEIPIEPFAFNADPLLPSEFTIEYMIDGIRHEYILEVDTQKVSYEGLFHYPEKKRRRIFEREGSELKIQRGLGGISGTRELLTDRTLALSVARRFDEPLITRFTRQVLRTQVMGLSPRRRAGFYGGSRAYFGLPNATRNTVRLFEATEQLSMFDSAEILENTPGREREQALALLKLADLGIEDVVVDRHEVGGYSDPTETRSQRRVRLMHRTKDGTAPLDFTAESDGTRTWFQLIAPTLTALRNGTLLLFDELDASLHPTLSAQLIRLFHEPVTNPHGAQLVFTSHDTSLLNHLNRDEVWLTEKTDEGATRLGALADFAGERVRKSQNLENAYLHGRFGALPQVDQTNFLRALGLIG
jgi:energy-coupling factor transporter ATP-binding protein EcfA2